MPRSYGSHRASTWAVAQAPRPRARVVRLGRPANDNGRTPSLLRMQAQHMPHAEVHIVREAGHSPYWEQPEAFNRILLGFLATKK